MSQTESTDAEQLHSEAVDFYKSGRLAEAIVLLEKAVSLQPGNALCHYTLGYLFNKANAHDRAIVSYKQAILLKPDYGEAHNNLANIFKQQGKPAEAIPHYLQSIQLIPGQTEIHYNLGSARHALGDFQKAETCYLAAIQLDKGHARALMNLGNIYREREAFEKALACYGKASECDDQSPGILNNLGNVYQIMDESRKAIDCYQRALTINADAPGALNNLTYLLLKVCDWPEYNALAPRLDRATDKALAAQGSAEEPFLATLRHDEPERNFKIARAWSGNIARQVSGVSQPFSFDRRESGKSRITIGYFSANFRNHPESYLLGDLFKKHDRRDFTIHCYSCGKDDGSKYRRQIEVDCDSFVDVWQMKAKDIAERIHRDQVDILVDLNGHFIGSRLDIFALRPAPVQVAFLGYPGTTGAGFMDYIIVDKTVCPDSSAAMFSERPVFMPKTYFYSSHASVPAGINFTRSSFHLPEDKFVFCSFVQPDRIDEVMFSCWMKILQAVPDSVLWLLWADDLQSENLCKEAKLRGVAPERLVFAEKLPWEEHLARIGLADLTLDTRIYNGHTSTCDALWSGVPVVTLQGNHFAARVAASLVSAVGLPELITTSLAEYESLAVGLATDKKKLSNIRQQIMENRTASPLFDTERSTKNLERAYRKMWDIYKAGEEPRVIRVVDYSQATC